MKIINALVFSFIFSVSVVWAQQKKYVVLISIDGLRPEFYQGGDYPVPNLKRLMKEGTYARHMKSVFPSYTYPSHVAMVTGALPARAGIYHNLKNDKGEWNWFTRDIKVPTLWQAINKAGLSSSTIEWPVSVTKEITYNVPEIWIPASPSDRITAARPYATPGLIEEIELNATGKLDSNNMNEEYLGLDNNAGRMAAYIFTKYNPNLLAVHFCGVDGKEHQHGREHPEINRALANNDHAIGMILEAIERSGMKDSTTVLVVGDHGMADINTVFRPNMLIKELPAKFTTAGGSAFLHLEKGVSKAKLPGLIKSVTQKLDALPVENRKRFRIIYRKELDKMGADSSAVMALAAVPGLVFSGAVQPAKPVNLGPGTQVQQNPLEGLFVPTTGGHHGYDPNIPEMHTGFIAAGAGITKGKVIEELCVTDIAPLIAELLGLEFRAPNGKLVPGILASPKSVQPNNTKADDRTNR